MVHRTKKMPAMSPDPFLACMMGFGNETIIHVIALNLYHMICKNNQKRIIFIRPSI